MATAHLFAARSTCDRAKVGAVFALESRILATGYNGAPAGMEHCDHTCICSGKVPNEGPNDGHWPSCPAGTPCARAVHAEANGVAYAAKMGIPLDKAHVYTTLSPCVPCAQLLINAGIKVVWYATAYRITDGLHLLERANIYTGLIA